MRQRAPVAREAKSSRRVGADMRTIGLLQGSVQRMQSDPIGAQFSAVKRFADTVRATVSQVIVGKERVIDLLLVALLSDGHVLLEDTPGMGKTVLAKSLARALDASFQRIQGTPDLEPTDVTGVSFFDQKRGEFVFRPGPIFGQVLLFDEINRTTPRTQSALLEAMAEGQVTVDRETYPLPHPFLTLATQNPIELDGTF